MHLECLSDDTLMRRFSRGLPPYPIVRLPSGSQVEGFANWAPALTHGVGAGSVSAGSRGCAGGDLRVAWAGLWWRGGVEKLAIAE